MADLETARHHRWVNFLIAPRVNYVIAGWGNYVIVGWVNFLTFSRLTWGNYLTVDTRQSGLSPRHACPAAEQCRQAVRRLRDELKKLVSPEAWDIYLSIEEHVNDELWRLEQKQAEGASR